MRCSLFSGVCILVSAAQTCNAEVMSSPPFYGDFQQSGAVCYLGNITNKTITIKDFSIIDHTGTALTLNYNTCGSPSGSSLGPQTTCYIQAAVTNDDSFRCAVNVKDKADLRGMMELRNNDTVFHSKELR